MDSSATNNPRGSMCLIPAEKDFLRRLARLAVEAAVSQQEPPDSRSLASQENLSLEPRLIQKRGAFVTLTTQGNLRGCIGYIEGHKPLIEAVVDNARSAAVGDPRFMPVSPRELPEIDLEISALTPLQPVAGPEEIELGRHGIILSAQGRRAVFLPQVAVEQNWDLTTTLHHLALKAGLTAGSWQQGAQFQVFEAEIF